MPYSNSHSLSVPPLGLTLAFNVAEACPTPLAAFVSTDGAATFGVLNVTSGPSTVPLELEVVTLKWYSVLGVRPAIFADTATGLDPDPGSDLHATAVP